MLAHELAESAKVSPSVVRYYSRIGLLAPARNPDNDYREYSPGDARRLQFIRKARWLGLTLCDIRRILDQSDRGVSPCAGARKLILKRMRDNERRLAELEVIQERLAAAVASCNELPDDGPDERRICGLIDRLEFNEDHVGTHSDRLW